MGSILSSSASDERVGHSVNSESATMSDNSDLGNPYEVIPEANDDNAEDQARMDQREKEMLEFHKQLNAKREQRKEILGRHRAEKEELQKALDAEKLSKAELSDANRQLRELLIKNNIEIPEDLPTNNDSVDISNTINQMRQEFENLRSNNIKLRMELANSNTALQTAYSEMAELSGQNIESFKHIKALKDVVTASKTMIGLREQQLNELKNRLSEIEKSLADKEASLLSNDLRQEYVRQLENIRTLRSLYEERARLAEIAKLNVVRELEQQKKATETEIKRSTDLMEKVDELETKIEELDDVIENKNNTISTIQNETQTLKSENLVVNKLFSQVLLGYISKQDLDNLAHRLKENHSLLTQMAEKQNDSEVSFALPKLLLEIVSQVDDKNNFKPDVRENATSQASSTPEEIVEKLPKVWKVLMELLSLQNISEDINIPEKITTCYKSIETNAGPVLVPSVSQTYIRLKDLIVEKLSLVKEVNRIKQLNVHLETRLEEQEHRLCHVTNELSKTWNVVGRLRKHHHQLHTHEKILKYELQQKRKLLNELKEELEYCRNKWEQAREKNSQSEKDWIKLRSEFSDRHARITQDSLNNSPESGFSDNRPSEESSESNDESEYTIEPLLRKRKNKKIIDHILDSSGECNLAAEREDPVSDLIDIADLPLDSHEDNQLSDTENAFSTTYNKTSEVEAGEISNSVVDEGLHNTSNSIDDIKHTKPTTTISIDPGAILKSIKEQNERLARKDRKLEELEKDGKSLLKKTQMTGNLSEQIENTLDHILNRPSCSSYCHHDQQTIISTEIQSTENTNSSTATLNPPNPDKEMISSANICSETDNNVLSSGLNDSKLKASIIIDPIPSTSQTLQVVDFKAILANIEKQNKRLNVKDERLNTLERACTEVVKKLTNTVEVVSEELKEKMDNLHKEHSSDYAVPSSSSEKDDLEEDRTSRSGSEPSVSSDIDHEAIFAARDERLKRLEEQTKSLVKRVNKTNSKGVKINYKLEELHNIYGSESSRAGTPSDDSKSEETKVVDKQDENDNGERDE